MRAASFAFCIYLALQPLLNGQCSGQEPEYSLMNATRKPIYVMEIRDRRYNDGWELPLRPSQSVACDDGLTHVKVRLASGRVLDYRRPEIVRIRTQAGLDKGDWIVDERGLHFISCQERSRLFKALDKYE